MITSLRDLCRSWLEAEGDEVAREDVRAAVIQSVRATREDVAARAERERIATIDQAIAAASAADSDADALAQFRNVDDLGPINPITVRASDVWREQPDPPLVLWRDADEQYRDSVAAEGEVTVLAGAGKVGKSQLLVSLAVAGAHAARDDDEFGSTCGLRIRAGRVVILSYEDAPKRIDMRVEAMGGEAGDVLLVPRPPCIFGFDPELRQWREAPDWSATWKAIRDVNPVLVAVDTGPKAMGGETIDTGAVIGFLQALEREAHAGGFAVLVTAHDTKASRDATQSGAELGAGAIAGSSQWHDSARGVLHLTKTGPGDAARILEAVKSNYGPDGWGARLEVHRIGSRYAGLVLDAMLNESEVQMARAAIAQEQRDRRENTGRQARGTTDGTELD